MSLLLSPDLPARINEIKTQKRLQQNRRSQQSFRHRQAKLVQDLKGKVQELQKENEDLIRVISSFGDAGEIVMDRVGKRS